MPEYINKDQNRTKPNYFYSIISVALVLFLLGFFGLIMLSAQNLITTFKEKVNIMVEIMEAATTEEIQGLQKVIEQAAYSKDGSIKYTNKEEAARMMREDFGEDFLKLDLPNPLYDVITFNVRASYLEKDSLENIKLELHSYPAVSDVYYQESLVNQIAQNIRRIGFITLGIGLFFILVAITLIHNTIRLALYANRHLIKNMQLVGASWEFISRPYLNKSMLYGLLSSIIAISALGFLFWWIKQSIPELSLLENITGFIALALTLTVLGVLINALSTYFVVKKYLKMRVDDLY